MMLRIGPVWGHPLLLRQVPSHLLWNGRLVREGSISQPTQKGVTSNADCPSRCSGSRKVVGEEASTGGHGHHRYNQEEDEDLGRGHQIHRHGEEIMNEEKAQTGEYVELMY
ncbi:hypothetical protein MLD38_030567 [Melastoma candidum]|uniref:Uncharacterized protein n=1 Tax=Melastoma candidum TaxID=119954 RepID=A0ACB9MNY2_9MYRT|nr:hypothetical protein MLD38_030567 [Melastoma candidum]